MLRFGSSFVITIIAVGIPPASTKFPTSRAGSFLSRRIRWHQSEHDELDSARSSEQL